jgi:hypothetical protein
VALYRLAFGEPRQNDLLAYLAGEIDSAEFERLADDVKIDLAPLPRGQRREARTDERQDETVSGARPQDGVHDTPLACRAQITQLIPVRAGPEDHGARSRRTTFVQVGEWVEHREFGVGEVLERDGRQRLVRFASGVHTVANKYTNLSPESLEVRAFLDLPRLLTWIEEEPANAATELLRSHQDGLDARQATRKLTKLGVPGDVAARWWTKTAEPLLRARDDVTISSNDSECFTLRQGPDPEAIVAEATEALIGLSKKRVTPDQRSKLARAIEAADRASALPPALRGAARGLGARLNDAPPLADVDPAQLPADVVRRLVERDDPTFLARAAVDARGPDVARAAAERCREQVSRADRAAHAAVACDQVQAEVSAASSDTIAAVAERLTHRVERLRLLVPDGPTPALVAAVLQLVAAVERIPSQDKQLGRLREAAEGTIVEAPDVLETFSTALRLDGVAGLADDVLAGAWAGQPLGPATVRFAWLRALARDRKATLSSTLAWKGIDVSSLHHLARASEIGSWLSNTEAGRTRRDVIGQSILNRLDRASLGELIAGGADLLETLPPDRFRAALDQLIEREPSLRVLADGFAASRIETVEVANSAELETLKAKNAERLQAAAQARAAAEARAEHHRADAELARRLVRSVSSGGASAAELRQAHIDGLRVAADVLAEVERAKGLVSDVGELAGRLEAIAEANGLRQDAATGDVVTFDHQRHRPASDEDIADGTAVTVVEPAWLASRDGGVTAIRYGLVRSADS